MRHALLALLVAVASGLASAQPAVQKPPPPAVQAELAALDKQLAAEQGKQAWFAAVKTAKKLYELQRKATGVDSPQADAKGKAYALTLNQTGDYAGALAIYKEQLALIEQKHGKDSREALYALYQVTAPLWSLGRYDELEPISLRLLNLTKKIEGEQSVIYVSALNSYGSLLNVRNEYAAAMRVFEDALAVQEALAKTDDDLIGPLQTLGAVALGMGQTQKAIATFDREVKILDKSKQEPRVIASWLWSIVAQYTFTGHEDLAAPLRKRAIDIWTKEVKRLEAANPDDPMLSQTLGQLGMIYRTAQDLPNAEKVMSRAVAIDEKRNTYSGWLAMLADIKLAQGKPKEAVVLLEKTQKQLAQLSPLSAAMYNLQIAEALRQGGDFKRAQKLIGDQLATTEKQWGKSHPSYAVAELTAAYIAMSDKQFAKAEQFLSHSLDVSERELQTVLGTGTESDHAVYFQKNGYQLDTAVNYQLAYAPTSASAARLGLTTVLRRKGRVLDAAAGNLATIRAKLSPEDKKLLDDLANARAQLAKLTVAGPAATGDTSYVKAIAALEEQVQKLEVAVGSKSAAYRATRSPVTLATVQRAIPKGAKLVEILSFVPYDPKAPPRAYGKSPPREYLAYVVGATGDPATVRLGPIAAIDAAIEQFRKSLSDPKDQTVTAKGRALFDLTMAKIVPKLGTATEILVAPDGALNVVPFSALVDAANKFLVETYNFTYLTSGRDLLRLAIKTKAQGGGVMFADPAFDATPPKQKTKTDATRGRRSSELGSLMWPPLPGTGSEADGIEKQMRLTVYRHDKATEGTLKQVHGPRVLHLATHGFFLPDEPPIAGAAPPDPTVAAAPENPLLRSGLALAGANALSSGSDDGILTAMEASGLDLWGTKLVVLSACETGVGKVTNGDGVYGLRRALVIAGAESLVMSLWQVDDEATKELMVGFYQRLKANKPRSSALRETQLEIAHRPSFAHPFYWASFVPAGSNEPLGN